MAAEAPSVPGTGLDPERMPGHLLLAQIGKRVLCPGGVRLTARLLQATGITAADDVIGLGPGPGATAKRICKLGPASYTGIERDQFAAVGTAARLGGRRHDSLMMQRAS
jgi:16S rRNA A1518/A1519 N6-dimethyltransferase RsmA/KsgA/DIM1 with predicted DNA glycosylase/AP lyase activity